MENNLSFNEEVQNTNIATIGGGNGHSFLLRALRDHTAFENIKAIVSMSDDGRTTGVLMRAYKEKFGKHLPPPGDLRRCLFSLSNSKYSKIFQDLFEDTFKDKNYKVSDFTTRELFKARQIDLGLVIEDDFWDFLENKLGSEILDSKLDLDLPLDEHKLGNLLMVKIYNYCDDDYMKMMQIMHNLMELDSENKKVIPVTTDPAYIEAELETGELIQTQDEISNGAKYDSPISELRLMENSKDAKTSKEAISGIKEADYIVISPGDLFTSTIANTLSAGFKEAIQETKAKIICVLNSTNKGGETAGYNSLMILEKLEKYFGKKVDIVIGNSCEPKLTEEQKKKLKNNISVKGGGFIIPNKDEIEEMEKMGITYIQEDLLPKEFDEKNPYRYDPEKLAKTIEKAILEN